MCHPSANNTCQLFEVKIIWHSPIYSHLIKWKYIYYWENISKIYLEYFRNIFYHFYTKYTCNLFISSKQCIYHLYDASEGQGCIFILRITRISSNFHKFNASAHFAVWIMSDERTAQWFGSPVTADWRIIRLNTMWFSSLIHFIIMVMYLKHFYSIQVE